MVQVTTFWQVALRSKHAASHPTMREDTGTVLLLANTIDLIRGGNLLGAFDRTGRRQMRRPKLNQRCRINRDKRPHSLRLVLELRPQCGEEGQLGFAAPRNGTQIGKKKHIHMNVIMEKTT